MLWVCQKAFPPRLVACFLFGNVVALWLHAGYLSPLSFKKMLHPQLSDGHLALGRLLRLLLKAIQKYNPPPCEKEIDDPIDISATLFP
jgi:hypothetical protein